MVKAQTKPKSAKAFITPKHKETLCFHSKVCHQVIQMIHFRSQQQLIVPQNAFQQPRVSDCAEKGFQCGRDLFAFPAQKKAVASCAGS